MDENLNGEGSTAIVETSEQSAAQQRIIEKTYGLTTPEFNILRQTVCVGAPREMAAFFLAFCKRRGLDPFAKHVYLWKQRVDGVDKWQIVSGIDAFRVIASRNPFYRGTSRPKWTFELDDEGKPKKFGKGVSKYDTIEGKRMVEECEVIAYRATVHDPKGEPIPYYGVIRFDEYVKRNADGITGNWAVQPENQSAVRAEVQALRKAFPEDVGSIFLEEELTDRERPRPVDPVPPNNGAAATTRTAQATALLAAQRAGTQPQGATLPDELPEPEQTLVDDQPPPEVDGERCPACNLAPSEGHRAGCPEAPPEAQDVPFVDAVPESTPKAAATPPAVKEDPETTAESIVALPKSAEREMAAKRVVLVAAAKGLWGDALRSWIREATGAERLVGDDVDGVVAKLRALK